MLKSTMRQTLDTILVGLGIVLGLVLYKAIFEAQQIYYQKGAEDTLRKVMKR